jgi:hypothetical protein
VPEAYPDRTLQGWIQVTVEQQPAATSGDRGAACRAALTSQVTASVSPLAKGAEQFGNEQRITRRTGHLGQQPRARLGGNGLSYQASHSLPGQGVQGEMPGAGNLKRVGQPVQLGTARGGPRAPDDGHRKIDEAAGQRTHRQQARRIGPLQVIQANHQGP